MLMRTNDGDVPFLQTELPGPEARKLIALDERYTSPSYTRGYPLAVARASGATIEGRLSDVRMRLIESALGDLTSEVRG